jgi:hypothetical protein
MASGYAQLKKDFFNTASADPEVQKLAAHIQKQDSMFKFLPEFVKKNGIPRWDKVLYKMSNSENNRSLNNQTARSETGEENQGLFFIPLQGTSSTEIKSYITAYKHNDSTFTYRLYNRDSLNALAPGSPEIKANLLHTQAVFGYFEKQLNGKDSIAVTAPAHGAIKNVNIAIEEANEQVGRSKKQQATNARTSGCYMEMTVTITYEWRDFSYCYEGCGTWVAVDVQVSVAVFCFEDPGGGGGYGGGGGTNWWSWGTGWPYYNGWNDYRDPNWYWWWTGGGNTVPFELEIYTDFDDLGYFYDDPTTFEDDNMPITFDASQDPWPTIPNVLSSAQFVEYDKRNCLVLAREQIAKAGVTDLGYGSAFKTYTESSGVNAAQAKAGVDYIISKLQSGKPVMVGVDNRPGTPSPLNADGSTDHFIVIIGAGSDANGNYFTFADNASNLTSKGMSPFNKLYYNATTGMISGYSAANGVGGGFHDYIVTQVRKNK